MKSTTSTSENPIILPTTTHDDNIVPPPVCDVDGDPLKTGKEYIIKYHETEFGSVYWGKIGNTRCPNTVMLHKSAHDNGTAVKFFLHDGIIDEEVTEGIDINIMFSVEGPCANETIWKVGKHQDVVTDGTLGSNLFKIQKYGSDVKTEYKLTYLCEDVCLVTMDNGNIRLAIRPTGAPPFVFAKAKNP